jgi:hypothetical protein
MESRSAALASGWRFSTPLRALRRWLRSKCLTYGFRKQALSKQSPINRAET